MASKVYLCTSTSGTWSNSPVGKDTTSTTECRPTISSTSTMTSNPYMIFNCDVPSSATVTAISVKVKMRAYSSSRTASVQLYNGTTSISSKQTVTSTSSSNIASFNATSTPSSFTNLRLYFAASSTTSTYRPYVYGAEITITYTVPQKTVTYTVQGSGTVVQDPSGTSINIGSSVEWTLTPGSGVTLTGILDNGVDVTEHHRHHTHWEFDRSVADSDFTITQRVDTSSRGWRKATDNLTYTSTISGNSVYCGVTRFTTNFEHEVEVTLKIKWNSQNTSDYMYVGNFDTSLSTTTTKPTTGTYQYSHAGTTTQQTYTMTIPEGSHYFDLYNYHAKSNSSRACTVIFSGDVMKEVEDENIFVYEIEDVQENHTLVFTFDVPAFRICTITYDGRSIAVTQEFNAVNITYNGSRIVSNLIGTKTLYCNGKVMASDVVVGTKTLYCGGDVMASDITVTVA